jgi:hypothetical protein
MKKKLKSNISCQTPFNSSTLILKYSDLECTLCARRALLTFSPDLLGVAFTVLPRFLRLLMVILQALHQLFGTLTSDAV